MYLSAGRRKNQLCRAIAFKEQPRLALTGKIQPLRDEHAGGEKTTIAHRLHADVGEEYTEVLPLQKPAQS